MRPRWRRPRTRRPAGRLRHDRRPPLEVRRDVRFHAAADRGCAGRAENYVIGVGNYGSSDRSAPYLGDPSNRDSRLVAPVPVELPQGQVSGSALSLGRGISLSGASHFYAGLLLLLIAAGPVSCCCGERPSGSGDPALGLNTTCRHYPPRPSWQTASPPVSGTQSRLLPPMTPRRRSGIRSLTPFRY